jgi:hypothetical protein
VTGCVAWCAPLGMGWSPYIARSPAALARKEGKKNSYGTRCHRIFMAAGRFACYVALISWSLHTATCRNRSAAFMSSNNTKKPSSPVGAARIGLSSLHSNAHRLKAVKACAGGDLAAGVVVVVERAAVPVPVALGAYVPPEQRRSSPVTIRTRRATSTTMVKHRLALML